LKAFFLTAVWCDFLSCCYFFALLSSHCSSLFHSGSAVYTAVSSLFSFVFSLFFFISGLRCLNPSFVLPRIPPFVVPLPSQLPGHATSIRHLVFRFAPKPCICPLFFSSMSCPAFHSVRVSSFQKLLSGNEYRLSPCPPALSFFTHRVVLPVPIVGLLLCRHLLPSSSLPGHCWISPP